MKIADEVLAAAEPFHSALLIVSPDGELLAASAKTAAFLGLAMERLQVGSLFEILAGQSSGVAAYLRLCARTTTPLPGVLEFKTSSGGVLRCRAEGAALRLVSATHPDAVIIGISSHDSATRRFFLLNSRIEELSKEVRQRKALQNENISLLRREQEARETAEDANRLKDEFLAVLSHELRTPLNAILGWATLLENDGLDHQTRAAGLQAIQRSARAQGAMINDILDISRIVAGKIRLNLLQCNLGEFVKNALDAVCPAATGKEISLNASAIPMQCVLVADPERLQQVLWNLVSNAVKFTPKGGSIRVEASVTHQQVEINVVDSGMGIDRKTIPFVFDRFRQADGSSTRRHGGLGLGLAISQQLVQLHGGTLTAASPGEGLGSTFTVTLPLRVRQEVSELRDGSGRTSPVSASFLKEQDLRLAGARLLLVEDDQESREMLYHVLRQLGADVRATSSAQEALFEVDAFNPDCLISDIEMPGEDGYTLIRKIRNRERSSGKVLPAVAVTAYARAQDRIRALEAGFQMHISKPVEPGELAAVLMTLLGRPLLPEQ